MNDLVMQALCGAGGAATVGFIAKWAIGRSLQQFEEMVTALHSIETRLAAIDVQISSQAKLRDMVHEHDRDIASLKSIFRGNYNGNIHSAS